jgi:sigma-B regulation protein RsbU (phosphoserine phosphatase)
MWYGIYERSTRTLRYGSAGHPPALALHRDGAEVAVSALSTPVLPVGMFVDTVFTCGSYSVPSGGQLLLYSDGAFEIPVDVAQGKPWSRADFVDLCTELAAQPGWSLDDLVDRLRALSSTGTFADDCALVLLTFPPD